MVGSKLTARIMAVKLATQNLPRHEAERSLKAALADKNYNVRTAALRALTEIGGPSACRFALKATKDRNAIVVIEAVEVLEELGFKPACSALSRLALASKNTVVRVSAIEAIGTLRCAKALPMLVRFPNSRSSLVRMHAAAALGELGNPTALRHIRARLAKEQDESVRVALQLCLYRFGEASLIEIAKHLRSANSRVRSIAANLLAEIATSGNFAQIAGSLARSLRVEPEVCAKSIIAAALADVEGRFDQEILVNASRRRGMKQ